MLHQQLFDLSPADAGFRLADPTFSSSPEERSVLLMRSLKYRSAEALILSVIDNPQRSQYLLLLRLCQGSIDAVKSLLESLQEDHSSDSSFLFYARQSYLLQRLLFDDVINLGLPSFLEAPNPWHSLLLASAYLWLSSKDQASSLLSSLPQDFNPPERIECEARLLFLRSDFHHSLKLLSPLLESGAASSNAWELSIHLLGLVGESNTAKTLLKRAHTVFPRNYHFYGRDVVLGVLERRPIMALRSSLLERLHAGSARFTEDQNRSDANLGFAYENGGRADLLRYRHSTLRGKSGDLATLSNHALQMASLADPSLPQALRDAEKALIRVDFASSSNCRDREDSSKLKVGIVGSDFNYHPVGRFILMQLNHNLGCGGELHVVSTGNHSDWTTDLAKDLTQQQGHWHSLNNLPFLDKLSAIRDLNLDVAVDLGGWTGKSIPSLFASRIALVQANYLGFFASSGIPEMDYWLGDNSLFPEPMSEWHTESIYRMRRCFLAWHPFENLPEGNVSVVSPPESSDIVFGSFNHVRKLSHETLRLWGKILASIPGSKLALKAYTSDDPGTVYLLKRRMIRCGLDPERVIWLPTPPKPEDHLAQYGIMDVSLDPFPNGGCTTTCESLWMGVPVITLRGDSYVGRMSAAVLTGADLSEWIANSEEDYLNKALQAADQLSHIRQSRSQLRTHLVSSSLYDVSSLNDELWTSFKTMFMRSSVR